MTIAQSILTGTRPPSIYRMSAFSHPNLLLADLAAAGWRTFFLDGRLVEDKASFLRACATALEFPGYFGNNWDAFEECLGDLAWAPAPGYLLLYDRVWRLAKHDPAAWHMARTIFQEVINDWRARQKPFYVLLRHSWWYMSDVEMF